MCDFSKLQFETLKHSQEGGGFEAFRIYLSPGYGDWVGISNVAVVDFLAVVHLKWRFII